MNEISFNPEFIKTIITQTTELKVRFSMSFLINLFFYIPAIYIMMHFKIWHWWFIFLVLWMYILTSNITAWVIFKILSFNRFKKLQKQKIIKEKELQKKYNEQIASLYKVVKPVFDTMPQIQKELLKRFVTENSLKISIANINSGTYSSPVYLANYITAKTYPLGLYITIGATLTHTILSIEPQYFDILFKYFNENNN